MSETATLSPDDAARFVADNFNTAGAAALDEFADAVERLRPPPGTKDARKGAEVMRRAILREARGLAARLRA